MDGDRMKKLLMIVIFIFILTGCQKPQTSVSMIVPSGSPELAQLFMQDNKRYQVDIVNGADPLVAAFGSGSHDVIFAPTQLGAKMYTGSPLYELLGIVVWGNLYLVSATQISSLSDLNGKEVTVFGRNQTADIILRHLLSHHQIEANLTYVDSVATATSLFLADPTKIVLTAEPSFSKIQSLSGGLHWISLQEAYQEVHGISSFPQSGIFVKKDMDLATRRQIEDDLKDSIERVKEQPGQAVILAEKLGSSIDVSTLPQAILNSNLEYRSASIAKEKIILYFEIIMALNSQLIGTMPPDAFYGGSS